MSTRNTRKNVKPITRPYTPTPVKPPAVPVVTVRGNPVTQDTATALTQEIERLEAILEQRRGLVAELTRARDTEEAIALMIRANYQEETALGLHNGMNAGQIAAMYMLRERKYKQVYGPLTPEQMAQGGGVDNGTRR